MSPIDGFQDGRQFTVNFSGKLTVGPVSEPVAGPIVGDPDDARELSEAAREYLRLRAQEVVWRKKRFGGDWSDATRLAFFDATAAATKARKRLARAMRQAEVEAVRVDEQIVAIITRRSELDSLRGRLREPEFLTLWASDIRL